MKPFKLLGIIGDPVAHSLSPAMHNAVLRKGGFRFFYMPFHVSPDRLKHFVRDVFNLHLAGFNVTIPHKERIMRYLSWISPEARRIGAVNTVVVSGRNLKGYNTDAAGYLRSLRESTGFRPRGRRILALGAGGAARAVAYAVASAGAKEIRIANRTASRARRLAREFGALFPKTKFWSVPFEPKRLKQELRSADLLVNTTSVGMRGTSFGNISLAPLRKTAIVSDLVYRPRMTRLLRAAKRRGLRIHTGDGMLLHQGAESLRLWTGRRPNLAVMRKALLLALKRG